MPATLQRPAEQPTKSASGIARKSIGRAAASQSNGVVFRRKRTSRKTGPSIEYRLDRPGNNFNYLTPKFIADVEFQFDRLIYRHDPRKIIRAISKRTGATEEAVAHILLVGKLRQYRAECREFRKCIAEVLPRVAQAGAEAWKKRVA
jgi:hypothetical protein